MLYKPLSVVVEEGIQLYAGELHANIAGLHIKIRPFMIYRALHDLAPAYLSNSASPPSFPVHFSHPGIRSVSPTGQMLSFLRAFAQDLPSPLTALLMTHSYSPIWSQLKVTSSQRSPLASPPK